MKKIILLLFIPLLLLVTSCELLWDEPLQGDFYYVVLGLDYSNDASTGYYGNDLEGTIHDAEELFQTFTLLSTATGKTPHGYLMLQKESDSYINAESDSFLINRTSINSYPSVVNVTAVLKNLAEVTKQEDLIIFTYSGHGYEDTGDLALAITTYGYSTASDALSPDALLALMDAIPGKKLLIIDSCYSGNFVKESTSSTSTVYSSSIGDYFDAYFAEAAYEKPNLFALSASADTKSYEGTYTDIDHNHGIFSHALLEALGWNHQHGTDLSAETLSTPPAVKNGRISVDGIYRYIKKNQGLPYKLSLSTFPSNIQHPMTNGGALDMILFTY